MRGLDESSEVERRVRGRPAREKLRHTMVYSKARAKTSLPLLDVGLRALGAERLLEVLAYGLAEVDLWDADLTGNPRVR